MTSTPKSLRPLFDVARHAISLPLAIVVFCFVALNGSSSAQAQASQGATARQIGTVKSISGNNLTVKTDSGSDAQVVVEESARILRASPGQKSLQEATPGKLEDIQVGDRVLARGTAGADSQSVQASLVVIMKQTDLSQKQEQEREDWQKRGIGGLITAIDPSGTITVSVAPNYTVAVKTSSQTVFLRYAPESVKFADATRGTFDQIKNGDQLRARGTRSADGKELTAEEVVSGSFRNIAGTILSVDAAKNTLSVMDVLKKKPVTVKFSSDSQLRKLPQMAAVRIAAMLKGRGQEGSQPGGTPTLGGAGATPQSNQVRTAPPVGRGPGEGPAGDARPAVMQRGGGGPPDFQQIIGRLPAVTLNDLQKGDAVMIVSTEGGTSDPKAITLLSGVEPILTASPNGASAAFLSAWNIGGGEGGAQ